jgi:hypothetical protein
VKGKAYWVTYAVRRRLGEQKPFLWYRGGVCFLFAEDGVLEQDDSVVFLWAIIDADASSTGIPEKLIEDWEHNVEVCCPTQTSTSCSPTHQSEIDGRLRRRRARSVAPVSKPAQAVKIASKFGKTGEAFETGAAERALRTS